MKIIVLEGVQNIGKTTTLNLVWDILVNSANGATSQNRLQIGGDPSDFSDIVIWGKKKIAFFTMGDNSTELAKAIYGYSYQNCDVMVCALSTNSPKKRAN